MRPVVLSIQSEVGTTVLPTQRLIELDFDCVQYNSRFCSYLERFKAWVVGEKVDPDVFVETQLRQVLYLVDISVWEDDLWACARHDLESASGLQE